MLDLGPALDKYRDGREPTAPEKQAFGEVAKLIEDLGGDPDILRVAHVLIREVEDDRDQGSALVASILDAEVVAAGQGFSALDYLRGFFQKMATTGGRSDPEIWVSVLEHAGLNLIGDSTGRTAQLIVALRHVVKANRDRFVREFDTLPLALFADDLPPLPVPNLSKMHEVSFGSDTDDSKERNVRLDRVARRVPKFVLDGLPGSGKTTAVLQLCARWSTDPAAPQPLYAQLRRIAPQLERSSDLTIRLLVEAALSGLDGVDDHIISAQLAWMQREDNWLLVLDGLDETLSKRSLVTDGLLELIPSLAPNAGVMLVTRHTALPAVKKLQLPVVTLGTPRELLPTLLRLVEHVAANREVGDRSEWLSVRQSWLRDTFSIDRALWRVPLTATLMTLAACREAGPLGNVRKASLLKQGIEDSVRRWESSQPKKPIERQDPDLNESVLISAFIEISHKLATDDSSARGSIAGVRQSLMSRVWGSGPARCSRLRVGGCLLG